MLSYFHKPFQIVLIFSPFKCSPRPHPSPQQTKTLLGCRAGRNSRVWHRPRADWSLGALNSLVRVTDPLHLALFMTSVIHQPFPEHPTASRALCWEGAALLPQVETQGRKGGGKVVRGLREEGMWGLSLKDDSLPRWRRRWRLGAGPGPTWGRDSSPVVTSLGCKEGSDRFERETEAEID